MSKFVDRPRFGCAMAGALALLRAIPSTIPIIHSSTGCGFNCYNGTNSGSEYLGGGYCGGTATPSSNVVERHVVFGGEGRLREQIRSTLEIMDGDLYVVVTGCMVEMIGGDALSVAQEFRDEGEPVLAVSTPSFQGNSCHGYELLFSAFAREIVRRASQKKPNKVNVLGLIPGQDVFYKGNLREIKRVLERLGLEVNTFIGEGETLENFYGAGDAALNIVLSDVHGIRTAQEFERVHGIPYLATGLPIGYLQTEEFLRSGWASRSRRRRRRWTRSAGSTLTTLSACRTSTTTSICSATRWWSRTRATRPRWRALRRTSWAGCPSLRWGPTYWRRARRLRWKSASTAGSRGCGPLCALIPTRRRCAGI